MVRTNVVVDEELVERVKQRYGLRTTREAIDFALRRVANGRDPYELALELRGSNSLDVEEFERLRGHPLGE